MDWRCRLNLHRWKWVSTRISGNGRPKDVHNRYRCARCGLAKEE